MPEPDLHIDPQIGPFISALLCERVLEEREGVKSAIRIIDQLNRQAGGTPPHATMESFVPLSQMKEPASLPKLKSAHGDRTPIGSYIYLCAVDGIHGTIEKTMRGNK